ncbi:hypothetical protein Bbelb_167110 [Branchiostoma belcheri]|nr:hypothetical protein Bbelb_167110 [Branchiostoma belcheri]
MGLGIYGRERESGRKSLGRSMWEVRDQTAAGRKPTTWCKQTDSRPAWRVVVTFVCLNPVPKLHRTAGKQSIAAASAVLLQGFVFFKGGLSAGAWFLFWCYLRAADRPRGHGHCRLRRGSSDPTLLPCLLICTGSGTGRAE